MKNMHVFYTWMRDIAVISLCIYQCVCRVGWIGACCLYQHIRREGSVCRSAVSIVGMPALV